MEFILRLNSNLSLNPIFSILFQFFIYIFFEANHPTLNMLNYRINTFQLVSFSISLDFKIFESPYPPKIPKIPHKCSISRLSFHSQQTPPFKFKILEIFVQINRSFDNPYISWMTKASSKHAFSRTRVTQIQIGMKWPEHESHISIDTYLCRWVCRQQPNRCTHTRTRRSRFTNNGGQCVTRKGYWIFRRHDPRASTGNTPPRRV